MSLNTSVPEELDPVTLSWETTAETAPPNFQLTKKKKKTLFQLQISLWNAHGEKCIHTWEKNLNVEILEDKEEVGLAVKKQSEVVEGKEGNKGVRVLQGLDDKGIREFKPGIAAIDEWWFVLS